MIRTSKNGTLLIEYLKAIRVHHWPKNNKWTTLQYFVISIVWDPDAVRSIFGKKE
jgi:hypothetical protein